MGLTREEEITISSYEQSASKWSREHSREDFWKREIEIFGNFLPQGKIIEVGCGGGRDAKTLTKAGYDYTGIDITEAFLSIASSVNPQGKFSSQDLYHLALKDNSFDGFWCSAVLLHVPRSKIDAACREIWRVVRPRGVGFVAVKEGCGERMENDAGLERLFTYYSSQEFTQILTRNGFLVDLHFIRPVSEKTIWLVYYVGIDK